MQVGFFVLKELGKKKQITNFKYQIKAKSRIVMTKIVLVFY